MFTADQIVAHLVGDYILQSHWMATEKTKRSAAAAIHAVTYTLPFLLITQSVAAIVAICGTHFLIDRFRLARFIVWAKNGPFSIVPYFHDGALDGHEVRWKPVTATGYQDDVPPWLAVWLLIWADNTLHIVINGLAVAYL
mgnify:CR=1 FL=1